MIEDVDPVDFMTFEREVVEFLGEEEVEDRLEPYREEREQPAKSDDPNPAPNPSRRGPDPVPYMIYNARRAFDKYWLTGELAFIRSILDIGTIGRALLELRDATIVDPGGNEIEQKLQDIYKQRLWEEENFWDAFYELEMASLFERGGFCSKPIYEGDQRGPDILIDEFDNPLWVECKRKRDLAPEDEDWNLFQLELMNMVWRNIDIGMDSFALRIQSETELFENQMETLAHEIVDVVNSQDDERRIIMDDNEINLTLIDYYSGARTIDFDPEGASGLKLFGNNFEFIDMSEFANQAQPSIVGQLTAHELYSHLDHDVDPNSTQGSANASVKLTEEGELKIGNAYVVEYDTPNEVDYSRGIMSAINTSTSNLRDKSLSTAFIHIPMGRWNALENNYTEYNGEKVTQRKRVEISIKGILGKNPNINAIVLNSRLVDRSSGGVTSVRFGDPYFNKYPETSIPDEFERFLREEFTAEFEQGRS